MEEEWKDVLDDLVFNGKYEVSCFGRLRHKHSKVLVRLNNNVVSNYKVCSLKGAVKVGVVLRVHRIVAKAFIENPFDLPQVGHKDHDKENNCVSNLYWTTQSQNTKDGVKAGRINAKKRGRTNQFTKEDIKLIARKVVEGMGVTAIAKLLGVPRTSVSSVINARSNWKTYCAAKLEVEKELRVNTE